MTIFMRVVTAMAVALFAASAAQADTAELFGQMDQTWNAQVSPDGAHLALGCSPQGLRAICIYPVTGDEKADYIAPPGESRINSMYWASDKHLIFNVAMFQTERNYRGTFEFTVHRAISYNIETDKMVVLMNNGRGASNTTTVEALLPDRDNKILMSLSMYRREDGRDLRMKNNEGEIEYHEVRVDLNSGNGRNLGMSARSVSNAVFDKDGERLVEVVRNLTQKNLPRG